MKIVFFSSVFNHHSLELADELYRLTEGNFFFIETLEEEQQRRQLGYHPYERPYVLKMYESQEMRERIERLTMEADVMIAGVFPYELLKKRLDAGKLSFLCQERRFKSGDSVLKKLRALYYCLNHYLRYAGKSLKLLSIGRYAAEDYHSFGFFRRSSYLWAYYPISCKKEYGELAAQKKSNTVTEILFVGRLISWKHPDYAVRAAEELRSAGYNIHLSVAGCGEMQDKLEEYVRGHGLEDTVSFLGSMPPESIQSLMEKANIFAFTSDRMEGWGAVLSEAMGAGCALVASSTAGASSTLIKDGENGLLYYNDSYEMFRDKLFRLVSDSAFAQRLGENAYKTMHEEFCARVAAERFVKLCGEMLSGEKVTEYKSGPISLL